MKGKRIVAPILILVLALQLLPVKQAIRYFFVDNPLIEEFVHADKGATKNFRLLDEDHSAMHYLDFLSHRLIGSEILLPFHTADMLPHNHSADIQTPPPNRA